MLRNRQEDYGFDQQTNAQEHTGRLRGFDQQTNAQDMNRPRNATVKSQILFIPKPPIRTYKRQTERDTLNRKNPE